MPLKEKFLQFAELQRSANSYREAYGSDDPKTVDAYQRANEMKRLVMNEIEELEGRVKL
jgi:hypothetical protein